MFLPFKLVLNPILRLRIFILFNLVMGVSFLGVIILSILE